MRTPLARHVGRSLRPRRRPGCRRSPGGRRWLGSRAASAGSSKPSPRRWPGPQAGRRPDSRRRRSRCGSRIRYVRLRRKRFGWDSREIPGSYRLRTLSRILWTAWPVFSVAFVTDGLTAATVLSTTSLAVRTVAWAAGATATTMSFVAFPTASTAGRRVCTALSKAGWSSFAARSSTVVPTTSALFTARSAWRRRWSISLRGVPHDGQYAASAGNTAPHFGQFIPLTAVPQEPIPHQCFGRLGSILARDLHFCRGMHDAGRVRFHNSSVDRLDIHPMRSRGRREPLGHRIRILLLRAQLMVDNRPLPAERIERHVEVFTRVEVAHDHPIRDPSWSDCPAVAEERHQVRRAIEPCVLDQVAKTHRIEFASVDGLGSPSTRDRQREVTDPPQTSHHDGPRTDSVCDADSLGEVAGGEHHARDVHRVSDAALDVHRFGSVSPEDLNVRNPHRPVDPGTVLDYGSSAQDDTEDFGDHASLWLPFGRQSEDEDVTDPLPSSGRMREGNARGLESFADFVAWIPMPEAMGKIDVRLEAGPQRGGDGNGARGGRGRKSNSPLSRTSSPVDEALHLQVSEQ